ncbi:unknown protein (Partial), partial [Seminavis robusta]|eukprot:Sro591_g172110.1 n/a (475) ;mRNA; f:56624-58048
MTVPPSSSRSITSNNASSAAPAGTMKTIIRSCLALIVVAGLLQNPTTSYVQWYRGPRKLSAEQDLAVATRKQPLADDTAISIDASSGIRSDQSETSLQGTADTPEFATAAAGTDTHTHAVSDIVPKTGSGSTSVAKRNDNQEEKQSKQIKQQGRKKKNKRKEKQSSLISGKKSKDQQLESLPPLDSLIGDLNEDITGDVQFLLDFAIVGFGKCGTTALINWLDDHPEINTIPKEALHLPRKRPALMVQKLHQMKEQTLLSQQQNSTSNNSTSTTNSLQGFKNPSDVRRPESMAYIQKYWPQTKLIITVRHPVLWFQSLYNFLVNEMGRSQKFLRHTSLIGGPHKNTAYAHTGKGEFHAILSLLGKTPLNTPQELELLQGFLQEDELEQYWPPPTPGLPNPIFFLDTSQMSDSNETRAAQFRYDLQDFLGLQQPLPPVPHVRPGKDRNVDESLKMDICAPENDVLRAELMRISRKA